MVKMEKKQRKIKKKTQKNAIICLTMRVYAGIISL